MPPLDNCSADVLVEALLARVELDDGDEVGLRIELAKLAVADGPARAIQRAPESRESRYTQGRGTRKVQEVDDDSDGPAARLAKGHDARALGGAFHTQLVADGNARAANVLVTLKSFGIL